MYSNTLIRITLHRFRHKGETKNMGFSLSKGKQKIEGPRFLKAEHIPKDVPTVTFRVKKIHPPPKGLNITMMMELEEPIYGREYFPVSRSNWLMLAGSWPDDNTDSLVGSTVQLRIVTTQSQGDSKGMYSRLHFDSIIAAPVKGKKSEPVKIKELPRRQAARTDNDEAPAHGDDDIPF